LCKQDLGISELTVVQVTKSGSSRLIPYLDSERPARERTVVTEPDL
jgi:hypothetical protein